MKRLLQLWNDWEVQTLVVISFVLQVFLFFTGSLRKRSRNMLLNLFTWIAYLSADWVAIFALGLLSRNKCSATKEDTLKPPQPLAFIWASFLLIHLGGQDTITAFAIEDNNLWLRHLLTGVVQLVLTLYIFGKSGSWHNVHLLVPGIFTFTTGVIKYGERTIALMYANLKSPQSFTADKSVADENDLADADDKYSDIVYTALHSMPALREIFGGRTVFHMNDDLKFALSRHGQTLSRAVSLKLVEIELGVMYHDLYTKATVLRTSAGIIFRCTSQVCFVVALILFHLSSKQSYSEVDAAITYALFIGGFCLEVCAAFLIMMSPWTWAWFQARKWNQLASMSWLLISTRIGWSEKRLLWSNSMGQYSLLSYAGQYNEQSCSWKQQVMKMIRKIVDYVGIGRGALFFFSKSLDPTNIEVDKEIMECVVDGINGCLSYADEAPSDKESVWHSHFPNLAQLLKKIAPDFIKDYGVGIVLLHLITEEHLSKYSEETALVCICRKLSNYMMYLFVTYPEMLPVSGAAEIVLKSFFDKITNGIKEKEFLQSGTERMQSWGFPQLRQCKETLEEIRSIWIRLLIYAAGKSRPEKHAAQLAKGGELFTFTWVLMAHEWLGDSGYKRVELTSEQQMDAAHVFYLDITQGQQRYLVLSYT